MSWFHREKKPAIPYDPKAQRPAVRRSICTGEMTVGFVDLETGRFMEYMLARDQRELENFCRGVGIDVKDLQTIY